jgi:hypothetical protein
MKMKIKQPTVEEIHKRNELFTMVSYHLTTLTAEELELLFHIVIDLKKLPR